MLFSVIVPIYNIEKYIRRCIDSVLLQSFTDFELILVDDGSPDRCGAICDEYAKKDERIKVIHKENGGLVSARQAGIKVASGDYIFHLDGDDAVLPDALTGGETSGETENKEPAKLESVSGVISDIRSAVVNGNSIYYIALDGNKTYYAISASDDDSVVILNTGDKVKISYKSAEGNIITAKSIER